MRNIIPNCYNRNCYRGNNEDDRGLLLPFLVGAAVAFPIGYIASNNNKQQMPYAYNQMYMQQPMPYRPPYYYPTPGYY